jgi:hypothetical protein
VHGPTGTKRTASDSGFNNEADIPKQQLPRRSSSFLYIATIGFDIDTQQSGNHGVLTLFSYIQIYADRSAQ